MLFNKSNRKESPVRPRDNSLSKDLAVLPDGGKGYGGEVSAPAKVVAVLLEEVLSTPISVDDSDRPWPGTKKGMLFEFIERSGLDGCSNADQLDWAMDDEAMNLEKLDDGKVIEGRLSSLRVHLRTKHLITKVSPGVWRATDFEERERARRKAKKSAKNGRPLPSRTSKFGIVYYLLPADGSKIRASVIIDQLINDPVFNCQNKDRSGVSADVSSTLGRLRTQGLAMSEGGRHDMTWGRAKPEKVKSSDNGSQCSDQPLLTAEQMPDKPQAPTKYFPEGVLKSPSTKPEWTALLWERLKAVGGSADFVDLCARVKKDSEAHGFRTSMLGDDEIENKMRKAVVTLEEAGDIVLSQDKRTITIVSRDSSEELKPEPKKEELEFSEDGDGEVTTLESDDPEDDNGDVDPELEESDSDSSQELRQIAITEEDLDEMVKEIIKDIEEGINEADIAEWIIINGGSKSWRTSDDVDEKDIPDMVCLAIRRLSVDKREIMDDENGLWTEA